MTRRSGSLAELKAEFQGYVKHHRPILIRLRTSPHTSEYSNVSPTAVPQVSSPPRHGCLSCPLLLHTLEQSHQQPTAPCEGPSLSACLGCLEATSPRNGRWGDGLEAHKSNGYCLRCRSSGSVSGLFRVNMATNEELSETAASALCHPNITHGTNILGVVVGKHYFFESSLLLGSFTRYIRGKHPQS